MRQEVGRFLHKTALPSSLVLLRRALRGGARGSLEAGGRALGRPNGEQRKATWLTASGERQECQLLKASGDTRKAEG